MNELHSQSVKEISAALAKAQNKISAALKDTSNPFYKSTYADLSSVWAACRIPLSENGLAVEQSIAFDSGGWVLVTILAHTSGEWFKSYCPLMLPPNKQDMQALGSSITYARRYSLAAIVGVVQEDDDGNAASVQKQNYNPPKKQTSTPIKTSPNAQGLATNEKQPSDDPSLVLIPGAFYGRNIEDLELISCGHVIAAFTKLYKEDQSKYSSDVFKEMIGNVRKRKEKLETPQGDFAKFNQPTSVIQPRVQ